MKRIMAVLFLAAFLGGCVTSQPVDNIMKSVVPADEHLTKADVGKAIKVAVNKKGWRISKDEPGLVQARIVVRGRHTAVVDPKFIS